MSETLSARTACYDVYARCWIEPAIDGCRCAGPATRSAKLAQSWAMFGRGLCERSASTATVVTAGGHDHPIAAATIRRLDPDALVDSMGTADLVRRDDRAPGSTFQNRDGALTAKTTSRRWSLMLW
jgi:xylulokinase